MKLANKSNEAENGSDHSSVLVRISDLPCDITREHLLEDLQKISKVLTVRMDPPSLRRPGRSSAIIACGSEFDADRLCSYLSVAGVSGHRCIVDVISGTGTLSPPPPSNSTSSGISGKVKAPPVPARPSMGPKVAPPLPPKLAGKAPPPIPGHKPSIGGSLGASHVEKVMPTNELINIYWKPASSAHVAPGADQDMFLKPFFVSGTTRLSSDNPIPGVLAIGSGESTIFSIKPGSVPEPSLERIKQYFSRKQNTKFDGGNVSSIREETAVGGKKSALDKERVKLIGLALGGTISSRGNRRLIFRQYREAIVKCDYAVVTTDVMHPLLQLLKKVTDEEAQASIEFVRSEVNLSSYPEAIVLEDFEEADVFIYEMSKIPEVKVRLECMIFELTFEDLFQLTVTSLNIIYAGLDVISRNIEKITRLFQLILKTGNLLNEGSKMGSGQSSFCLATLTKLNEVKSSVDPKVDILHFILAHCPSSSDETSFLTDEEIVILKNASNLRCYRVRDEVKDLLDSITAVTEILRNPIQVAGPEDQFLAKMSAFANRIFGSDLWLSKYAFNVFASYKALSNYFEDTKAVYPPPKEKTTDQFDIIELFAWFGPVVRAHEKELKKRGLRYRLSKVSPDDPLPSPTRPAPPTKAVAPILPAAAVVVPPPPLAAAPAPVCSTSSSLSEERAPLRHSRSNLLIASSSSASSLHNVPVFQVVATSPPSVEHSYPARRHTLTKEQVQNSLSNLSSSSSASAPPLVAIINRGTGKDLTASRPKLSPVISPTLEVIVTEVAVPSPSEPTSPKYVDELFKLKQERPVLPDVNRASQVVLPRHPLSSSTRRSLLLVPQPSRKPRADITVSVIPRASRISPEETKSEERAGGENTSFFANSHYPSRNAQDSNQVYPNYGLLNSRQSLSNTISRVAMLLSPGKDDGTGIYKTGRKSRPSLEIQPEER